MGSEAVLQMYIDVDIRDSTTGIVIVHTMHADEATTAKGVKQFWWAKMNNSYDWVELSIGGQGVEDEEAVLSVMESRNSSAIDLTRSNEMTLITIRDTLAVKPLELHMWIMPQHTTFERIKQFWSKATGGRRAATQCFSGGMKKYNFLVVHGHIVDDTVTIKWNGERIPNLRMYHDWKLDLENALIDGSSSDSELEAGATAMEAEAPDFAQVAEQRGTPLDPPTVNICITTAGQPGNMGQSECWCSDCL